MSILRSISVRGSDKHSELGFPEAKTDLTEYNFKFVAWKYEDVNSKSVNNILYQCSNYLEACSVLKILKYLDSVPPAEMFVTVETNLA